MPGEDYTSKRLTIAQKGLNKDLEPTLMKGMYTPVMENMMIEGGNLKKFYGYEDYGNNPRLRFIGGTEIGCSVVSFIDYLGIKRFFAFTEKTGFVTINDASGNPLFVNINPGTTVETCDSGWTDVHGDLAVSHDSNQQVHDSSVKIHASGSFSDADKIAYKNFDAKDLANLTHICGWVRTTKQTGESLKLVISEAADGAKAGDYVTVEIRTDDIDVDRWRFFCEAVDLSSMGDAISVGIWNDASISWASGDDIWIDDIRAITLLHHDHDATGEDEGIYTFAEAYDVTEFSDSDGKALVISAFNSTDDLMYWNLESQPLRTLVHGIPGFQRASCIIEFWNHFFIGGYQVASRAWNVFGHAAQGDIDDWASAGSGFYILSDTKGRILRVTKNDYMMNIYSEESISRGIWNGSYIAFVFPCIMENLGLLGNNALAKDTHGDFFIGCKCDSGF